MVSWRTWHSWGWAGAELGGFGVTGGAAGPCWLLGTLPALLGTLPALLGPCVLQGLVFQVWRVLQSKVFRCCCLQLWVIKVVQKRLIRFEDTKCSADTKYDCDYYQALVESFP